MKAYKRPFDEDAPFPLELTYRSTKGPQNELPDHFHEWYEIVYVYDGYGTFFINNLFYDMYPGDIFIIPSGTIHHTLPDHSRPLTSTALFFDDTMIYRELMGKSFSYMHVFDKGKQLNDYKLSLGNEQQHHIESLFDRLYHELSHQSIAYQSACIHLLHLFLLSLNRMVAEIHKEPLPTVDKGPKWMRDILKYIEIHLIENLTLSELAKEACVSPEHFSRVFKQTTGMNVTDYMTTKKVIKAKELLLSTDDNVAVIAEESGFYSTPHFYRVFKKYVGETPSSYRMKSYTS
ncbi:AraC-like DNA-binding protein [Pullulanibacillus pueri]|uniref:AraC family transcriptional regulator n=1 Tax=Pullulanibacillus pueri TaxID=1437324 RepID=A0A8J2ZVD7_9BACL|nr:AraC family transcriptional regulator [Pullulanibacillus pueri]MBM7680928.1 AraC-like DNA-binding protein [Pullulanibacillus pueri]GGH81370.1 AraC family transcriptional regulator [Pullulanibacillus pueri]